MRPRTWPRLVAFISQYSGVSCHKANCGLLARGGVASSAAPSPAPPVPHTWRVWRFYAAPLSRTGNASGDGKGEKLGPDKGDRRINRAVVARNVRLVTDSGHEILTRFEALNRAHVAGLDLVEVDGRADPPVCKLMDFSKERFKEKRREKELRKKQLERRRLDDLKEVRFSTRTEQKDLELKAEIASRLLTRGHRIKVVVQSHAKDEVDKVGGQILQRMMTMLEKITKVENGPRVEKHRAWVLLRPTVVQQPKVSRKGVDTSSDESEDDTMESDEEDMEGEGNNGIEQTKSSATSPMHHVAVSSGSGIG